MGERGLHKYYFAAHEIKRLSEQLEITDDESLAFAEELKKVANTAHEIIEATSNALNKWLKQSALEFVKHLEYVEETLAQAQRIDEEKLEIYAKQQEEAGNKDIRNQILERMERAKLNLKKSNKYKEFKELLDQFCHSFVMARADATVRYFTMMFSRMDSVLSRSCLSRERARKAHESLQKARRYLQIACEEFPPNYTKSLNSCIGAIDDAICSHKQASHRHEDVYLNTLLETVMDVFLVFKYSKRQAYSLTGQLLVKYDLLEDSKYLPDKVRHRYQRCKQKRHCGEVE